MSDERREDLLRRLSRALVRRAVPTLLVVHDALGLSETGWALLAKLEPFLVEPRRGSSRPGRALEAPRQRWVPEKTVVRTLESTPTIVCTDPGL